MYKMLNLSLKELRLIAKNRNIKCYEIMPKDKLLKQLLIIRETKRVFLNQKKKKPKKVFTSQQEIVFLN